MNVQVLINGRIFTGKQKIESGYIRFNYQIIEIGSMDEFEEKINEKIIDINGKIIIPGLIDIHMHGGYGIDAMDGNPEDLLELSKLLMNEGVTSFFPTTMTQSVENIEKALKSIKTAKENGANIQGVHLEGPFISKKRAGAQPLEHIRTPDAPLFERWQQISGNLIKLVTYAPEQEGAEKLASQMKEMGVIGSIGHSDAKADFLKGCMVTHATHLFNGMRGLHHREPGVVGYSLLSREVQVEIIVDGIHVHPDIVKLVYAIKGSKKISVITDAMRAKGLTEGIFELGGQKVTVQSNHALLHSGTLAGSVLPMDQAFRNIISYTGCSIEEAVEMTSVNQAREFNLHNKGVLESRKDADFVVMTEELSIVSTYSLGKCLN